MSTLIGNPQKRASTDVTRQFPQGLDMNRSEKNFMAGDWRAADSASFRQGQPLMLNSSREIVVSDGTSILGVAAWPKMSLGQSVVVDFPVTLTGTSAISLLKPGAHAPVANIKVRNNTVANGGTAYTVTTDYTVSTSNGTITRVGGGGIASGTVVYVSYTYALIEADYLFEGKNFQNSNDWVTYQDNRIAVIEAPAKIYTTEFDQTQLYAYSGSGSTIYVNSSGQFTSDSSGNKLVGYCINVPGAQDPYLGVKLIGQVAANT